MKEAAATEAALLRLLWVKRELLSLHPLNQFLNPIKQWLIGDAGRHDTVMVDLLVDLDALLTHVPLLQAGMPTGATCATHYKFRAVWFLERS
jgi:hypothetical protein